MSLFFLPTFKNTHTTFKIKLTTFKNIRTYFQKYTHRNNVNKKLTFEKRINNSEYSKCSE